MDLEGSLIYSQELTTGPCSESNAFSSYLSILDI
jgi:hypothetical protein